MLHLILKTYKTSIVLHLSQHQQRPESLVPWGRLLFQVVNLQIPKEAVPEDEEDRERPSNSFQLLETLAEEVARTVYGLEGVFRVVAVVHKPGAAASLGIDDVSCEAVIA